MYQCLCIRTNILMEKDQAKKQKIRYHEIGHEYFKF